MLRCLAEWSHLTRKVHQSLKNCSKNDDEDTKNLAFLSEME